MIRLLIADKHPVVHSGLKQIFALVPDIEIAGEVENGEDALQQVRDNIFDLLLLGLDMPGVGGTDLISLIHACRPGLPILIFTMHHEIQIATDALKAGAMGFVVKDSKPEGLLEAIRKVSSGHLYIDPVVAEEMAINTIFPNKSLPHLSLSDRELEVFHLLVKGKSGNEIAEQLSISNKTVSTYKIILLKKMNLSTVSDLVRYALQHELCK